HFDRDPDPLGDLDDRDDVGRDGSRRAVGADLETTFDDLPRQTRDVLDDVRPGPGQSDVDRIDAELVHHVEEGELAVDRGTLDRRRLEAVGEGFVVQLDSPPCGKDGASRAIPVVNELGFRRVRLSHFARVSLAPATLRGNRTAAWPADGRA